MTTDHPDTDSQWTIGPAPNFARYMVLDAEDNENLAIYGHDIDEDSIRRTINHAGFGRLLDDIEFDGTKVADRLTIADLPKFETWARVVRGCPRHRWLPWWVRHGLIEPVDWVRWQVFRLVWRAWRRQHPHHDAPTPGWTLWLARRWRAFADCEACEYVDHYRTCSGCGFCDSDGSGTVPLWWDWATPEGALADANAGQPSYLPVTVISVGG